MFPLGGRRCHCEICRRGCPYLEGWPLLRGTSPQLLRRVLVVIPESLKNLLVFVPGRGGWLTDFGLPGHQPVWQGALAVASPDA